MPPKSNFLDKVLGRIGRLDAEGLQTVVQRLARERTFLETLFNTIEDGVLVVDEAGRILYLNSGVTKLLGIQPNNAEGQPIARYFPDLDWSTLVSLNPRGEGRVTRHEFEITYPARRFIHLYAAPLDGERTGSSGVALILHDATEARQKTFEAIENERVQALTLLAASVAHEIGNPLNALHIHMQLMERELKKMRHRREGDPGASVESHLDRLDNFVAVAKGEITRLDYIVSEFLEALRPRAPKFSPASLNHIVAETLELLRPEIQNRGQQLEMELAKDLPQAPLDPGMIKQALLNLVKNAMQAMTRGGQLKLKTGANADAVWVSVSDTGTGIAEEKLTRIFEPFFTTKEKGSGLGLMIVQRIVREHRGRIDLESKPGQGTTFRLWLPLHEPRPRLLGDAGEDLENTNAAEAQPED